VLEAKRYRFAKTVLWLARPGYNFMGITLDGRNAERGVSQGGMRVDLLLVGSLRLSSRLFWTTPNDTF
jgi:hypothetical protein